MVQNDFHHLYEKTLAGRIGAWWKNKKRTWDHNYRRFKHSIKTNPIYRALKKRYKRFKRKKVSGLQMPSTHL